MLTLAAVFIIIIIVLQLNAAEVNICKCNYATVKKQKFDFKIKAMIEVSKNIFYDSSLSYEEQSDEFQNYVTSLYENTAKLPYPDFNADGSISYFAEDNNLRYEFKRIQQTPFSKMDRAVKELQIIINVKGA